MTLENYQHGLPAFARDVGASKGCRAVAKRRRAVFECVMRLRLGKPINQPLSVEASTFVSDTGRAGALPAAAANFGLRWQAQRDTALTDTCPTKSAVAATLCRRTPNQQRTNTSPPVAAFVRTRLTDMKFAALSRDAATKK